MDHQHIPDARGWHRPKQNAGNFFFCILVLHYFSSSVFALVASKYLFIADEYQILLWFSVNCPLGGASSMSYSGYTAYAPCLGAWQENTPKKKIQFWIFCHQFSEILSTSTVLLRGLSGNGKSYLLPPKTAPLLSMG